MITLKNRHSLIAAATLCFSFHNASAAEPSASSSAKEVTGSKPNIIVARNVLERTFQMFELVRLTNMEGMQTNIYNLI